MFKQRQVQIFEHQQIFQSICDRKPDAARQAMQAHLLTFQRAYTLLGRIEHSAETDPAGLVAGGG